MFSENNLSNFIIGVTDVSPNDRAPSSLGDSEYTVCAFYEGAVPEGQTVDIPCSTSIPVRGSYLFILRKGPPNKYLQLCEVEVYAWIGKSFTAPQFAIHIEPSYYITPFEDCSEVTAVPLRASCVALPIFYTNTIGC